MSNLKMTTTPIPDGAKTFHIFAKSTLQADYAGVRGYVTFNGNQFSGSVEGTAPEASEAMRSFPRQFTGSVEGKVEGGNLEFTLTSGGLERKFKLARENGTPSYVGDYTLKGWPYQLPAVVQIGK